MGAAPIRANSPTGDPARDSPLFEQIQAEVGKLESLSGGSVKWPEVIAWGREILEKTSKDILVAVYVAVGLLEQNRYEGLLAGLSCIETMVESFWEVLYPEAKRTRARINALVWFSEKGGAAVSRKQPVAEEAQIVLACREKVGLLEKFFAERLGDQSPGLGDLRRAVDQWVRESKPVEPAQTPIEAKGRVTPAAVPEAAMTAGTMESVEDAERVLGEARDLLRRAGDLVRGLLPANPWPYQVSRALIWSQVEAVPANTDGETRIPAPPAHIMEGARQLLEQGAWDALAEWVESQFPEYPFWLDLQRWGVLALSKRGLAYEGMGHAVRGEVRVLMARLPDLSNCRFADGTPFADEETRQWIEKEICPRSGQAALAGEDVAAKKRADTRIHAMQRFRQGEMKEAMAFFQEQIMGAGSGRDRFLARLELARFCFDAGHPKIALGQLAGLQREMDRFSLDAWEPALSLEVLQTSQHVLKRLLRDQEPGSPDWAHQAEEVYERICRLDPVSALKLDEK